MYAPILLKFGKLKSFVGVLGGEVNRAYFFVGFDANSNFYYLDPHYCQSAPSDYGDMREIAQKYIPSQF